MHDEALSFIPTISLPSNAASFAFKRRFIPSDKLSYWYKFDSNMWSAVYKRTYGKYYKFKAGYDSEVRLGWASLWIKYQTLVFFSFSLLSVKSFFTLNPKTEA
ncbi:hypothetical protein Bca52824_018802 [Brassica carinata]|uniref:Uncharacterized protein n=1 Tax=Brassica carinata TaxID=52824 RepID=A0A8X7VQT7_BRACI|nr:hypothetical protein Bca52824_018802 [Brassica carinata]